MCELLYSFWKHLFHPPYVFAASPGRPYNQHGANSQIPKRPWKMTTRNSCFCNERDTRFPSLCCGVVACRRPAAQETHSTGQAQQAHGRGGEHRSSNNHEDEGEGDQRGRERSKANRKQCHQEGTEPNRQARRTPQHPRRPRTQKQFASPKQLPHRRRRNTEQQYRRPLRNRQWTERDVISPP